MPANKFSFKINSTVAQAQVQLNIETIKPNVDWDNFLSFSQWLIQTIDGQFNSHDLGADLHKVFFEFEGTRLFITFEENSNSIWIELDNNDDTEVLTFIGQLLQTYA